VTCASVLSPERPGIDAGPAPPPELADPRMERLWSPAGATSGNQWQIAPPRKAPKQAKLLPCVASGCRGRQMVSRGSPVRVRKRAGEIFLLTPRFGHHMARVEGPRIERVESCWKTHAPPVLPRSRLGRRHNHCRRDRVFSSTTNGSAVCLGAHECFGDRPLENTVERPVPARPQGASLDVETLLPGTSSTFA
jgi:hypothetical protein